MKSTKYLLIGGGLASGQAAKQIRQRDPEGTVTIVGEEPHAPYDRPPLSKEFLRGEKSRPELFFDSEQFYAEKRIELVLGAAVTRMVPVERRAELAGGEVITYEKALIATGGRPVRLKLPGGDLAGVHYLRTLDDSAAIGAAAAAGKRAVLIGAGFIGMEVAASLTQRGVRVTVIEAQPHIWARFADRALAGFVQDYAARKGVEFITNDSVAEIRGAGRVSSVLTRSGRELPCDLVCIGVGIVPNVELAREAGLTVDNGIIADEFLQSSHPDVYVAGDVASYVDPIFGKRRRVEHWGHAEYCGQLAGQNMSGQRKPYDLLTYVWSDIFDLHLEFAGDESEHDEQLVRGSFANGSFALLYLKQNALRAYFAVNWSAKELQPLQRLIRSKVNLDGKEAKLQDPAVPIKGLD